MSEFFATLTLNYPIQDGQGNIITTLNIRRAKAKDMRAVRGTSELEQTLGLLATLTGLVPEDIDELDASDLIRASAELEKMLKGKSA